jgi:hypothetical protein
MEGKEYKLKENFANVLSQIRVYLIEFLSLLRNRHIYHCIMGRVLYFILVHTSLSGLENRN